MDPISSFVDNLQKMSSSSIVKNHIIATIPNCPKKSTCNGIKPYNYSISSHNKARVSPSSQELMELLTQEGTKHHRDNNMNVIWMIV